MKTTKEMIEVMEAYLRGEKIQVKDNENIDDNWDDTNSPLWSWYEFDYRVKPKHNKKYVPFDTAEEFLAAQKKYGCKVIHFSSKSKFRAFVSSDEQICVVSENDFSDIELLYFDCLFNDFIFSDGTPCGKEVEDE